MGTYMSFPAGSFKPLRTSLPEVVHAQAWVLLVGDVHILCWGLLRHTTWIHVSIISPDQ